MASDGFRHGAALLELVRCEHHRLDLGAKALPRHETINGFERITPRRQGFQALIGIKKSQMPHHELLTKLNKIYGILREARPMLLDAVALGYQSNSALR
jgi:hypothetical protein